MKKVGAILFLLLAAGCAGTRGPSAVRSVSEALRDRMVASLVQRNEAVRSLRGEATVRYGGKVFGLRGETAFALTKPDRLRIDGLAEFGVYSSQLALKGDALTILWPTDQLYFSGEAAPETFGRYLLIGLPSETVLNILAGAVPLRGDDPELRVVSKGRNFFAIYGTRLEVLVDERGGALRPVSYTVTDSQGAPVYRVAFEYDPQAEGEFPRKLSARFWENGPSRTKARVEIEYKDVEINPKLEDKLFTLKIPKDAEPVSE